MVRIKRYKLSELLIFVDSSAYNSMDIVPISRHRAKSYVHNPRANPDDVVLYMAYIDEEMVGYRTLLADTVFINDETHRVAWLSGNWVNPKLRRKGIASALFSEAFADWNGKLLFTNYALESKAVYDKTERFSLIQSSRGVRLYLRPCLLAILSKKGKAFRFLNPLWRILDALLWLVNPLPLFARLFKMDGVRFEYLPSPDDGVAMMFEQTTANSPSQRKRQELEWIIGNPWLVSSPLVDMIGQKYFFSSSPKRFVQSIVKVYHKGKPLGFVMINAADGAVSVPYVSCSAEHALLFAKIIVKHSMAIGANRLTVYNPQIADSMRGLKPFSMLSRTQYRNYFATKSLSTQLGNKTFLEGDGDCVFV